MNGKQKEDNPAWMTLTNASVQYVAATRPGKTEPQLVKRMHYVSFVGMFRSDLFEGALCGPCTQELSHLRQMVSHH